MTMRCRRRPAGGVKFSWDFHYLRSPHSHAPLSRSLLCLSHAAPDERTSCTNFSPLHRGRTYVGDLTRREQRECRRELAEGRTCSLPLVGLLPPKQFAPPHQRGEKFCSLYKTWIPTLLRVHLSWAFCSPSICSATSSSGPQWTPATTGRAPRAAACPSSRTSPSTARWWRPTCAARHPRSTACKQARRAPATSATPQIRS